MNSKETEHNRFNKKVNSLLRSLGSAVSYVTAANSFRGGRLSMQMFGFPNQDAAAEQNEAVSEMGNPSPRLLDACLVIL